MNSPLPLIAEAVAGATADLKADNDMAARKAADRRYQLEVAGNFGRRVVEALSECLGTYTIDRLALMRAIKDEDECQIGRLVLQAWDHYYPQTPSDPRDEPVSFDEERN